MLSDDEAMFNNDYGATDDDDDDDDSNNNRAVPFQFSRHDRNGDYYFERNSTTALNHLNHPLFAASKSNTKNDGHMHNQGLLTTKPSEQSRLIDDHQLERGDYNSTQR